MTGSDIVADRTPPSRADAAAGDEPRRRNSRDALLAAALEEFSAKGYEAATVAGIAARAGVTTGALYAHFSGKLDLLVGVVGLTPPEDILRSIPDLAAAPWHEAARTLGQGMAAPPDRGTALLLDVVVVARRDPRIAHTLQNGLRAYLDAMTRATDAGTALGSFESPFASDDLARLLALLTVGRLVFATLGEPGLSDAAYAQLAERLLHSAHAAAADDTSVLAGVRARARAADDARVRLHDAIVEAVEQGHSLRQVGDAAGLSHERVRQVLRERAHSAPRERQPS